MSDIEKKKKRKKKRGYKLGSAGATLIKKVQNGANPALLLLLPFTIIMDMIIIILRLFLILLILGTIGGLIFTFAIYNKYKPIYDEYKSFAINTVATSDIDTFQTSESAFIYDVSGNTIAKLSNGTESVYLKYDDIPPYAVDAFVAIEDRSFWENPGYDKKGMIRVGIDYIKSHGEEKHGASTITQQLARNLFLTHEVSLERKAKEILLAEELTNKYSKQEIMEFYINNICFANNIYGLGGAAKTYFGKDASELSLGEITYLCAIPNRPEYYNPFKNPNAAYDRREKILNDMMECGFITERQARKAEEEKVIIKKAPYIFNNFETTYALDCAVRYAMTLTEFNFRYVFDNMADYNNYMQEYDTEYEAVKNHIIRKGYKIYTTLDMAACDKLQEILDDKLSFEENMTEDGVYELQGAISVVDNETGKVIALTGGRTSSGNNIDVYSLNRAYQGFRQPGSSIKPLIVYTPSLENGYTMESSVMNIDVDKAKEILKERGKPNADLEKLPEVSSLTGKTMPMRTAVEKSINGVAWKLFDELTPAKGLKYLTDMNFTRIVPDDYYDSAALGGLSNGVTTIEMAGAYSGLVNHGKWKEPTCIRSIKTSKDKELYKEPQRKSVYKAYAADDMIDIMQGVITKGTASKLNWSKASDIPAAAKTGTTNNSKDGWLCGVTPYYSISVWVGYDQPKELDNLWGATYPGEIWKDSMLYFTEGKEAKSFTRDENDPSYEEAVSRNKAHKAAGPFDWLEGRADTEEISPGYTVGQYKADHTAGAQVDSIVRQMNSLNRADPAYPAVKQNLYAQGSQWVNMIVGQSYKAEELNKLNTAWATP